MRFLQNLLAFMENTCRDGSLSSVDTLSFAFLASWPKDFCRWTLGRSTTRLPGLWSPIFRKRNPGGCNSRHIADQGDSLCVRVSVGGGGLEIQPLFQALRGESRVVLVSLAMTHPDSPGWVKRHPHKPSDPCELQWRTNFFPLFPSKSRESFAHFNDAINTLLLK